MTAARAVAELAVVRWKWQGVRTSCEGEHEQTEVESLWLRCDDEDWAARIHAGDSRVATMDIGRFSCDIDTSCVLKG